MSYNLVHPAKALGPIDLMEAGSVILLRALQSLNAELSTLVTLLGIVTEVREEQSWNAYFPMLVTLLGIVTEVREEQPEKV